jgi:hypothetical protein
MGAMISCTRRMLGAGVLLSSMCAAPASAQTYFVAYLGANHTHAADVAIDVAAADLVATIRDVRFTAEPFRSPQYYGARVGHLFGARHRLGLELEFIHLKVIGDTQREYQIVGRLAGLDPSGPVLMEALVQRYAMTHGLNFVVVNGIARRPLGDRLALVGRLGAGITVPHAESTVLGRAREQYQFAGAGGHLAAGVETTLRGPLAFVTEYKLTYARPRIDVAGGSGQTTALTHHVAFGMRWQFPP